MEIRARINPISYEKPLLKRTAEENIVNEERKYGNYVVDYTNFKH